MDSKDSDGGLLDTKADSTENNKNLPQGRVKQVIDMRGFSPCVNPWSIVIFHVLSGMWNQLVTLIVRYKTRSLHFIHIKISDSCNSSYRRFFLIFFFGFYLQIFGKTLHFESPVNHDLNVMVTI